MRADADVIFSIVIPLRNFEMRLQQANLRPHPPAPACQNSDQMLRFGIDPPADANPNPSAVVTYSSLGEAASD